MIFASFIVFGTLSAFAQSPTPKPKYPAEIAAASKQLAEKQEACRIHANREHLTFLKRRSFLRACIKEKP